MICDYIRVFAIAVIEMIHGYFFFYRSKIQHSPLSHVVNIKKVKNAKSIHKFKL